MPVRLVIGFTATPGRGAEAAAAFKERCEEVMKEPGCSQFEVFQSVLDPDRLTLLELWEDEAALAAHAEANRTRKPFPPGLIAGGAGREDYTYNKTR